MNASRSTSASTNEWGTILGIWAHPDDEAYLSSGLMARAVEQGSRVVCVTATRGEGGSLDPERWPPETLGAVREAELLRCLSRLGVTEHRFFDLPDVDWESPLPDEGQALVREVMEEIRPDTVLTFGPDGMTGHEGHISVSNWAGEAFEEFAPKGARLFHAAYTEEWRDEWFEMLDSVDVYREGYLPPIYPRNELEIVVELDDVELERKMAALQEHESQLSGLIAVFGEDRLAAAMRGEYFKEAARR